MIEIETSYHLDSHHSIRIWRDSKLIFEEALPNAQDLLDWRAALANELLWLDRYIHDNKIRDKND